jgi:hypothetical protein
MCHNGYLLINKSKYESHGEQTRTSADEFLNLGSAFDLERLKLNGLNSKSHFSTYEWLFASKRVVYNFCFNLEKRTFHSLNEMCLIGKLKVF